MQANKPAEQKFRAAVRKLVDAGKTPSEAVYEAVRADVPSYIDMLRESGCTDKQIVANLLEKQKQHRPLKTMADRPNKR